MIIGSRIEGQEYPPQIWLFLKLTLLCLDDREERRLVVQKIVEIQGGDKNTAGDLSVYVLQEHVRTLAINKKIMHLLFWSRLIGLIPVGGVKGHL